MKSNSMRSSVALRTLAVALLAATAGVAVADDPKAQEGGRDGMTERESAQPVDDAWITTKVKADLLATPDVSGLALNVETVNGVVSLSGDVDSQAEVERAVAVARGIKGVSKVDASGVRVRNP
jgi:hyperosmotically inducible protein